MKRESPGTRPGGLLRACNAMAALALSVSIAFQAPAQQPRPEVASGSTVVLRGLDKISGETTDLELPVGERVTYARLQISVIACRYPVEAPESDAMAFLDITHARSQETLFRGWMFASSPALNALDDPRYDVWVLSCR